jgi:nicotinamidase-related amidase
MAITTLDPKTALVVIDLQAGIMAMAANAAPPVGPVIDKSAALAAAFRRHGLPVVLVHVAAGAPGRSDANGPGGAKDFPPEFMTFVSELGQQPSDHVSVKRTWGAFIGDRDLEAHLKNQGVTQVVICGVATSIGVESTARQAFELGFNVTLPIDAMTDLRPEPHANSLERIFPRLGETGETQAVLDLLAARS